MKKKIENCCCTCGSWHESENIFDGECKNLKAKDQYGPLTNYKFSCGEWEIGSDLYVRKSYSKLNA